MLIACGDAQINVECWGQGPPIALLHGFTGSSHTWEHLAHSLGDDFTLIAVDLLGHGASDAPHDPEPYRISRQVRSLLTVFDTLDLAQLQLLGYSMGGRLALHLALAAPERFTALILESTSPGIADPAEREQRRQDDETVATMIERDGVRHFVDYWERLPLFGSHQRLEPRLRSELRRQRLGNSTPGLAHSLRGAGAGACQPIWDLLPAITAPTLIIAGALDQKYVAIGRRMAGLLPFSELAIVPDSGHMPHLEQSEEFERVISCQVSVLSFQ
jgi:2-succinyl-6-hydroxy-2,4-cyclohexadiene-1-carboxylate synthase